MQRIGIMQGRLLPPEAGKIQCFPREGWMLEFSLAAAAELDSIEWIYDVWGERANPISSEAGIKRIRALADQYRVTVTSVCADYFMERPLIRVSPEERHNRVEHLLWLISRCQQLDIHRIVLPFVDNSSIRSESEIREVINILDEAFRLTGGSDVEIHLETSLGPAEFVSLLSRLPFPNVRVNYDVGNSASLGYDYRAELAAYGERIGSVHIKDRVRGGGTVPLGQGHADIPGTLSALQRLGYSGDFILQVARGETGKEVAWARRHRSMVVSYLQEAMQEVRGQLQ